MAHFFGKVQGQRGEATRLGSVKSQLTTIAASYQGAVEVNLYVRDGVDFARIDLIPWQGQGITRTLFDGPVSGAGLSESK